MSLARRTLIGFIVTCVIAGALALLLKPSSHAAGTAGKLIGERWYQLSLGERKIGYYNTSNARAADGSFVFATALRFALADEGAVTVNDSYRFAARPPHRLLEAQHQLARAGGTLSVKLDAGKEGYLATIRRNADVEQQHLDWEYRLQDYLAVEEWLARSEPVVGARITTISTDLAQLRLQREVFEITGTDAKGFELRNPALLDDTRIRLNRQLIPEQFQLAGVFDLVRSSREEALRAPEPLTAVSYRAPLDRPLRRVAELTRLALQAETEGQALALPRTLILRANPIVPAADGNYLTATLEHPSDHPKLRRLVEDLGFMTPAPNAQVLAQRVRELVTYVHHFIRYETGNEHLPVLEVLSERRGDCTEFADLFTSLARAAGIPARTITGMAYSELGGPALTFHAWNQVRLGDRWQAVDPTWDQFQVDATHWPLPADDRTALMLLTGQTQLRFAVLDTEYAEES